MITVKLLCIQMTLRYEGLRQFQNSSMEPIAMGSGHSSPPPVSLELIQ